MASKQYISIIRLFQHCDISTGDDFDLSRAKKTLQAEFTIAREGFIEVDGYSYSRHEVMEEVERTDFPQRMVFHKQLWESPQLLTLLEKNTADLVSIHPEFERFSGNKEFDLFFSVYFAGPFSYLSRTLLTSRKMKEAGDLMKYEDFLQAPEREEAFRPISQFLEENIRTLRNVNKENYKMMRPVIAHWVDTEWHEFFNGLPIEFYDRRHEIVVLLINISVAVQKSRRRDCKKVSRQLTLLYDVPEHLWKIIVANHQVYTRSRAAVRSNWGGSWWIGAILVVLIRNLACGGCSGNSGDSKYLPSDYKVMIRKATDSAILSAHDLKTGPDSFSKLMGARNGR